MKNARTSLPSKLGRRTVLGVLGTAAVTAPFLPLLGCDDATLSQNDAGTGGATDATVPVDGSASAWASGGTAAMTAAASYPDPFADAPLTSCALTCAMTEGPCYDKQTPSRKDVSEGEPGLPVRLALRLVDESCNPITDADVDIWHVNYEGLYSSATVNNVGYCTGNDADALAGQWFRGYQSTDASGVATFDTCFPGWYAGRAVHIHFTVRRPSHTGSAYLTSQLFFDQALITEIYSSHPDYVGRGLPDTTNASDMVAPKSGLATYVLDTARMSDGAMLASKTVVVRSSLAVAACSA